MPSLPPFFNGKISGVLMLSISDLAWHKSNLKSSCVLFEWTGSQEKHKLLTSKYSKITYDIRTSYKSFLDYLSQCTLKCTVKSYENKTVAFASIKNLLMLAQNNRIVKTLQLINNEGTVGTLQIFFNLQTFDDTSFDNDIKSIKTFGIQNKVLNSFNDKEFYESETHKSKKRISSSSSRTNKSKEELTNDYLMGKEMAPEEEEEALSTLRIMPSAESIVSAAEKISIYSPPLTSLYVQGDAIIKTDIRPDITNMKTTQAKYLKKPFIEINQHDLKKDFSKKPYKAPVLKDEMYLHLSILSMHVYRTVKSLENYTNSTYIVQCLKDQEPYKLLRFMSRHVDDNVVKFKNTTQSSHLEGCSAKGITIKAYIRLLSERNLIVLGETKQMLDWTGFSATCDVSRYIKVPIWNNDKISGHLSLSYKFSKTPKVHEYENVFSEKRVEDIIVIEDDEKLQSKHENISKLSSTKIKKNEEDYKCTSSCQMKNNVFLCDKLYPESNKNTIGDELVINEGSKKTSTKEKEIQTHFEICQLNKSVQTLTNSCNVAIQVDSDELEDPLDQKISYDVQNIFRCTHEFTFNIEKKCNSTFNYVTYQFPESVTNNSGKVTMCCRTFRTFGNTNILHLITLPTTTPLETYLHNEYKKAAIVLNLHQNNEFSAGKVSLLVSHLIGMSNEFKISHITKDLILYNNLSTSQSNIHVKLHYKKVYHAFPSPEKQLKTSYPSKKSPKRNSKFIVDLTESDSEDTSINKTYTLFKHNDRHVEVTAENSTQTDEVCIKTSNNCKTQTEKNINQKCMTDNDTIIASENKIENATQTDSIPIIKHCTNTKTDQKDKDSYTYNNSDIFKAKVTIVCAYNLPMVKLNGDIMPTAPTTYVIMGDYGNHNLSTSSVVQQTNPVWNSEWTVMIPKNKFIEGKWFILEVWCKKYKNEYAGHDINRDMRLGYILIDLCALKYNFNQAVGLYDIISETEENRGKIKIIIDPIDCINLQMTNNIPQSLNGRKNLNTKTNSDINQMFGKIQIENDCHEVTKKNRNSIRIEKENCIDYVDLTKNDSHEQKFNESSLKNTSTKMHLKDCVIDNANAYDIGTTSSVTSWTSSSDDILCSNNSKIVNNILRNETKMNRIKQIIQS